MEPNDFIRLLETKKMVNLINNSNKLLYPLEEKNIINKLSTSSEIETVNDYLDNSDHQNERNALNKLKKTIPNFSFNPHRKYISEEFYVNNLALAKIEKWFFSLPDNKKVLLHIGERGCGKTLTQNMFLNNNHDIIENNKTFWVRCDIHKLYHLWLTIPKDVIDEKQFITVNEYLDIQLIYVFCKYLYSSKMFHNIFNELLDSDRDSIFQLTEGRQVYQQALSENKFTKLSEILLITHRNIKSREINESRNPKFSYAVDVIMQDGQLANKPVAKRDWLLMSGALQSFLYEKGFNILFIVDGADNIKLLSSQSFKFYNRALEGLRRFIMEAPLNEKEFRYASIRKNTRAQLGLPETTDTNDYTKNTGHLRIIHDKNNIDKIFEARIKYANIISEDMNSMGMEDTNILQPIFDKIINNYKNNFKEQMYLYENNIRSFLYNQIGLAELVLYRYFQLNRPRSFDIAGQVQKFIKRNLFLNGKLYLNSKLESNLDQGDVFFNIFYKTPSRKDYDNCSLFLINFRILQLLSQSPDSLRFYSESNLRYLLNFYFNYDENDVVNCLNHLSEYCLVECEYDDILINKEDNQPESIIYYKISKKGKYFLNELLSDIDILYIISLDTYIPVTFITNSLIDSYYNEINKISYYRSNCIKSTISFLSFMLYSDQKENKRFLSYYLNPLYNQTEYKKHINEKTFDLKTQLNMGKISGKIKLYLDEISDTNDIKEINILELFLEQFN
jgi:hypothetical protein